MKNKVKDFRKKKKITQNELADLIGVSRQTINAIDQVCQQHLSFLNYSIFLLRNYLYISPYIINLALWYFKKK